MVPSAPFTDLPKARSGSFSIARSESLLERAKAVIPGLTLSMMKRPDQFAPGSFPVYLARGRGAIVTDVDDNEYVDFISGLAANSLGHRHPALLEAARVALEDGFIHSLPHEIELSATEALLKLAPNADMARFFKTGADATSAAVRLARAITGKELIITIGYNGWHDHFMFDTPGVPSALRELTTRLPLFTPQDEAPVLEEVERGRAELAAVLISLPYNRKIEAGFLKALRETCTENGVLLVFDEIITGFRLALGGAQELFGVRADLTTYSKALAAGMPLSAVTGPREHMERLGQLQVSTTFGGELLSLAVCRAALEVYRTTDYITRINELGRRLREGVNREAEALGSPLRVGGYDCIPFFLFDRDMARHVELMRDFQGRMAKRGVLLRRDVNFISGAHTVEHIDFAIDAVRESLKELQR